MDPTTPNTVKALTEASFSLLEIAARTTTSSTLSSWIEEQQSNLSTFSDMLGAQAHNYSQSADYKLQQGSSMGRTIKVLLGAITGNLEIVIGIEKSSNGDKAKSDAGRPRDDEGVLSPDHAQERSSNTSSSGTREHAISRIELDIRHLLTFAAHVRWQSQLKYLHDERANTYNPDHEIGTQGNRTEKIDGIIQESIRSQVQNQEQSDFRTPLWVYKRLHEVGLRRWKRLCYCRARADERASTAFPKAGPANANAEDSKVEHGHRRKRLKSSPTSQVQSSSRHLESTQSGDATSIYTGFHAPPKSSTTASSVASSVAEVTDVFDIDPPAHIEHVGSGWEFVCPLCRSYEAFKASSRRRFLRQWRQHALLDLAPYACLVENCEAPLRPFQSLADWTNHRDSDHAVLMWRCDACEPITVLYTEQSYIDHMMDVHRNSRIPLGVIESIAELKGKRLTDEFASCLICGSTKGIQDEGSNSNGNQTQRQAALIRCMARHMEDIALASLPEGLSLVSSAGKLESSRSGSTGCSLSASSGPFQQLRKHMSSAGDVSLRIREWRQAVKKAGPLSPLSDNREDLDSQGSTQVPATARQPFEQEPDVAMDSSPPSEPHTSKSSLSDEQCDIQNQLFQPPELSTEHNIFDMQLRVASGQGDTQVVQQRLASGADVDAGRPLIAASAEGHMEVINLLLDGGADVNLRNNADNNTWYGTALQAAAGTGQAEVVTLLLDRGADINAQYRGTALRTASDHGFVEVVKLLLNRGAKVDAYPKGHGYSAIYDASKNGHMEVVKLLLEKCADANAADDVFNGALRAAASNGHLETTKLLLDKGVHVNAEAVAYFATAIQAAAIRGQAEIVKLLLEKGADPNIDDGEYGSLLHATAIRGYVDVAKALLDRGAEVDANSHGHYGTPLQTAAGKGRIEVAKLLLEKRADVNLYTHWSAYGTALHAASIKGHLEIVRLLLVSGADVNICHGDNGSALEAASEKGNVEVVKLLLEAGADVNVQAGSLGTALNAATFAGNLEIVRLLLAKGADVHAAGSDNDTALETAAAFGRAEIVKMLLEADKGVELDGTRFEKALTAASREGHHEVLDLLFETRAKRAGKESQMAAEVSEEMEF